MPRIVNLTPHVLNIHGAFDKILTVEPDGRVARVSEDDYRLRPVLSDAVEIPVSCKLYTEIEDLPDPVEGDVFVVSGLVRAHTDRQDVFSPGELIRDDSGNPVGCFGLVAGGTPRGAMLKGGKVNQ